VPTRNAAQILTVTSAVNTPSGLVRKIDIGMFHFLDIAHLSIGKKAFKRDSYRAPVGCCVPSS
jgi:hypothetical protein